MEWSNELTLLLIELYRSKPCLWDPKDNNYRIKSLKNDAWKDISDILKCSTDEAKRKMESVLASFRRERQRQMKASAGNDGAYNSSWFAFKYMQFLMDKFQTRIADNEVFWTPRPPTFPSLIQPGTDRHTVLCIRETLDLGTGNVVLHIQTDRFKYGGLFFQLEPQLLQDSQLLQEGNEIEDSSIIEEKPDFSTIEEPVCTPTTSKDAEKRKDFDFPQQTLPQKKRYHCRMLQDTVSRRISRDDSAIFGEYIAMKLRGYSDYTKNVVEHLISNVIFEADMGKYNESPVSDDKFFPPFLITQVSSPPSSF